MENVILRIIVVSLLIIRTIYWRFSELKAQDEKPKTQTRTPFITLHIIGRNMLNIFIFVQLLGFNILPFNQNIIVEVFGVIICIFAVLCSIFARKRLGTNWTDSAESQIKTNHELVTSGVFKYIRHPIAVGYCFFILGAELLVESWLVIPVAIGVLAGAYVQSKKEEKLLTQQFGNEYKKYMQNTKMFLPYVW